MTDHRKGTREEWLAERVELLEREKELTRRSDELAEGSLGWRSRRNTASTLRTDRKRLAELFDGRSQLLVYHFMFGPEYTAGCPICSAAAECFDGTVVHLNHRGVTFVYVARAAREAARVQEAHGLELSLGLIAEQ